MATTAHVIRRNHLVEALTMHPFLYNPALRFPVQRDLPFSQISIGDDVWLGHNSVILPTVSCIGRGAVVGAGAVVTKDVPPYAIVGGNPARVLRYRFDPEVIIFVESTRWWEKSRDELVEFFAEFPEIVFDVKARSSR